MYTVFSKGEKVNYKGSVRLYTVDFVYGDNVALIDPWGEKMIANLTQISPVVPVHSDGWYTVAGKTGYAYWIHWDETTKGAVYRWGLNFRTQEIEAFPQPFGPEVVNRAFTAADFKAIKLTTAANL